MLNNKGSATVAGTEQMTQHPPHPFPTSDSTSEFAKLSDHAGFPSRPPRLMQTLPYAPSQVHPSSQGELQQPVQMLASSSDPQRAGYENGYAHSPNPPDEQQPSGQPLGSGAAGAGEAVKAFACGTCGKGFARRSDLARHGQLISTCKAFT